MTLYERLVAAGVPIDHHESDLYFKATTEGLAILKEFPEFAKNARGFTNNADGLRWIDVAFCYDPWWKARAEGEDGGVSLGGLMPIPETFSLFAHRVVGHNSKEFWGHVGATEFFTQLHNANLPVWRLEVRPANGDPPDLWGWWDNGTHFTGSKPHLSMVYHVEALVRMCFPYGLEVAQAAGHGELVPLTILLAGLITSNQAVAR